MASPACVHLTFAQGCDVNMVADLIDELKEEYATVKNKEVFTLINKLEKLNKATSRSKKTMAEIEKIIGAASRSFSVVEGFDFPGEPVRVHPKPKSPRPRSLAHRTPLSLVASLSDWIHRQGRHHDHRGQGHVNILAPSVTSTDAGRNDPGIAHLKMERDFVGFTGGWEEQVPQPA